MIYNEHLRYKEQTTMSYLMSLFFPLPFQFPGESLLHYFSRNKERWKVQSEEKRSGILQSICLTELFRCLILQHLFILHLEDASCFVK